MKHQTTFALFFGNRGFFPETLIDEARTDIKSRLDELGFNSISMDKSLTRYGAVETIAEGRIFADFLKKNQGKYQGIILCLPNFGDENGASEAMRDCDVPIFIHAYPDQLNRMDFTLRRDAFCGKLSIMDVFGQFGIPFTAWEPHTLAPADPRFDEEIKAFAAVCRITAGLKRCRIGAIGARPTAFKTIRFDEVALQKHGITTETFDNSDLLLAMKKISSASCREKMDFLKAYTNFSQVPEDKLETLARLSLALDSFIENYQLDALALRCWLDLEQTLQISPCVILSELNDRGFPAACELDVANALSMLALKLASDSPPACLDWNNNYENEADKCILFHCGPVPQTLMTAKGQVVDHPMFAKSLGSGVAFGCNVGRIRPMNFTFASTTTLNGQVHFYTGEGQFTEDKIPNNFFGCGGVVQVDHLQQKLNRIGYGGFRHHVSIAEGWYAKSIREALTRYLGYRETEL